MASYRYRAEAPAKALGANINGGPAEIAVFSKPLADDRDLAIRVKKHGGKVVVDICDPHNYEFIVGLADQVVCPTDHMAGLIYEWYEKEAVVIPDPYEFPEETPHPNGLDILWFGHQLNLDDLNGYEWLKKTVVTGPSRVEGTMPYSEINLVRAFRDHNWVLLPTRRGAEYKSPNRLLNSLRMGLFPVCDPHPAYKEFKDVAWTSGVNHGLKWAKHYRNELHELVKEGQDLIRDKYSPEAIGEQWRDLLDSI